MYLDSDELTTNISEWSSDEEIVKSAKAEIRKKYKNQESRRKEVNSKLIKSQPDKIE